VEFCELTGLSASTVRRFIAAKRIPVFQPGGRRCRVLIPRDALDRTSLMQPTLDARAERPAAAPSAPRIPGPAPRWQTPRTPCIDTQPEDNDAPKTKA